MIRSFRRYFRHLSIQTKFLLLILPLIIIPVLILGVVGFVTASDDADAASIRYLKQRENDLRTLSENPAIRDYHNNKFYGLHEEADVYRRQIEQSLRRFAVRTNDVDLVYPTVRYIDDKGLEVAEIVDNQISRDLDNASDEPYFEAVSGDGGDIYRSPIGETMIMAMPVYESAGENARIFEGAVVLEFLFPIENFERITAVIARTLIITTVLSLGAAIFLVVRTVRSLTQPVRGLADAADVITEGGSPALIDVKSEDEVGRLASSFNDMNQSLQAKEEALRQKVDEATTLYQIGKEITAHVALEPTLSLIVERARDLLGADRGLLALRADDGHTFEMRAASDGLDRPGPSTSFRLGEGIGGRAVALRETILVGDYATEYADSPFVPLVSRGRFHSAIAVPLMSGESTIGVLYVFGRQINQFDGDQVQLIESLATQAAISVENAQLYQQVRRHADELEARIAERTEELIETNQKLEAASHHKSAFLASMSHELRTPMNAIIGFTRLVMRRSREHLPQKQYENLQKIQVSADHLLALINDILDLSKIEAGRLELHLTKFDLRELVDECLRAIEAIVANDGIALTQSVDEGLPALWGDRDKAKQILLNLLGNAAKFTKEGGIGISVHAVADGMVAIEVADTGIGIPEHALQMIFDEFQQVDSSVTRQYGGTGLGLSISHHLARLMGGQISVTSTLGEGSTFTVTLPLHQPEEDARKSSDEENAADAVASANGKVVLAIDDDPDAIYLLRETLADEGYSVIGAADAEEGIKKARTIKPFAITLDIIMPKKDGWQTLQELKANATTCDIPVIMLTVVDERNIGYRLGVFDYLMKPFGRQEILSVLDRIVTPHTRLLVVDDDPNVHDLVQQSLDDETYQMDFAENGSEALEKIAEQPPEVILLDLLMPGLDGFAVIEALEANPAFRNIQVIVLTAKSLTAEDKVVLERRVHAVIEKRGIERSLLINELRSALGAYQRPSEGGTVPA